MAGDNKNNQLISIPISAKYEYDEVNKTMVRKSANYVNIDPRLIAELLLKSNGIPVDTFHEPLLENIA